MATIEVGCKAPVKTIVGFEGTLTLDSKNQMVILDSGTYQVFIPREYVLFINVDHEVKEDGN